jgi:hypothetical protein
MFLAVLAERGRRWFLKVGWRFSVVRGVALWGEVMPLTAF